MHREREKKKNVRKKEEAQEVRKVRNIKQEGKKKIANK